MKGAGKGQGAQRSLMETLAWKGWALVNTHPLLNRLGTGVIPRFTRKLPKAGPIKTWSRVRAVPELSPSSLADLLKKEGVENE